MIEGRRRSGPCSSTRSTRPRFAGSRPLCVAPGWRCLEIGAGGGTVCEWLSRRVGSDRSRHCHGSRRPFSSDTRSPEPRHTGENVVGADLPAGTFDLVHTRWTLMHIPARERVLQKLPDCLAVGGTLFLEEPDAISVRALDRTGVRHAVVARVRGSSRPVVRIRTGPSDLPYKLASLGLGNVRAEGRRHALPRRLGARRVLADPVGDACATHSLSREQTSRSGTARAGRARRSGAAVRESDDTRRDRNASPDPARAGTLENAHSGVAGASQAGDPRRTRTFNPEIKSLLLYH